MKKLYKSNDMKVEWISIWFQVCGPGKGLLAWWGAAYPHPTYRLTGSILQPTDQAQWKHTMKQCKWNPELDCLYASVLTIKGGRANHRRRQAQLDEKVSLWWAAWGGCKQKRDVSVFSHFAFLDEFTQTFLSSHPTASLVASIYLISA